MRREQGADWIEDLVEFPVECIEEACREWRRSQPDKRPTPGHIRMLAIAEQRRRNPPPEPVYLPLPEPRMADPVERAEMARRMGELARIVATGHAMPAVTIHHPAYEDPEALRRARIELGLEEMEDPAYEDPEALRRARIELGLKPMVEEVGSEI
jgi:hypothetical protein